MLIVNILREGVGINVVSKCHDSIYSHEIRIDICDIIMNIIDANSKYSHEITMDIVS